MNREQLMQAFGNVDESLIAEATGYERKAPRRNKWVIALLIVIGVVASTACGFIIAIRSGVTITRKTVDPEDPMWETVLKDAPYANEMEYAVWEVQDNPVTEEIRVQLEDMEGKTEYRRRAFSSVSEMEDAYGIRLLKSDSEEFNVQAWLTFIEPEDHADGGAHLTGTWNVWDEDILLSIDFSYTMHTSEFPFGAGTALKKIEKSDAYTIKSIDEVARLTSGLIEQDGKEERRVMAYFSHNGISYLITAFQEGERAVTIESLCDWLETLHE